MSEVKSLELHKEKLEELVRFRNMAEKLSRNKEFRDLILQRFMVDECAKYAQVSGDPAVGEVGRADALAMAQAAGHLKRFLSVTMRMGNQAEHDLISTNEAIEEARANSVEEGE